MADCRQAGRGPPGSAGYHSPRERTSSTDAPADARCFALVPCAGVGERAGQAGPKQYARIGRPRDGGAHAGGAGRACRGCRPRWWCWPRSDAQFEAHVPGFRGERAWVARCGGATRAATVANGLAELQRRGARADDWVLVHDAARCLLRPAWVDRLIDACLDDAVGGLLALPLADTLKQARDGRVERTLDRSDKWAAQTPQMFRLGLLQQALAQAGAAVTDEASAVEALGHAPLLVPGELENFKLTWPQDCVLAARLLRARELEAAA